MSIKNPEIYNKYFGSHIFNPQLNPEEGIAKVEKHKYKYRPTFGKTKEDVFNITPEKRIQRKVDEKESANKERLNRSAIKRKKVIGNIFGSDIFNQQKPLKTERGQGLKAFPNNPDKKSYLAKMGNNEEYIKDLKYYTSQRRKEKKEYNPDKYMKRVNAKDKNLEVHFKVLKQKYLPEKNYLKTEINTPKIIEEEKNEEKNYLMTEKNEKNEKNQPPNEKRFFKQKNNDTFDKKRYFADKFVLNISKINKQIQNKSYIFPSEYNTIQDIEEEAEEIKERFDKEKNKKVKTNVLGVPIKEVKRDLSFDIQTKGNHEIYDILTGQKKDTPQKKKKKMKINIMQKFDAIIDEIPHLNELRKSDIKMRASALDCNTEDDWDKKGQTISNYYTNRYSDIPKKTEVTGKVNEKKNVNSSKKSSAMFEDYIITYSTKKNQFEKFDDAEIKNIFGAKGIQIYDIHKNPFDKGNYNMINLKIFANQGKDDTYSKVKLIQDELTKKNYKINIEKCKPRNIGIKHKKLVNNPGGKVAIMSDSMNRPFEAKNKYTKIPETIKGKRGFTRQFDLVNYKYKKNLLHN